ncbi:MAG: RNA polymerase sigma factor, partial [Limisphaerales bacterium]
VLSGLPQIYREPMVLFYRQNESVPAVAEVLEISEEAVRQRLSRGRIMLAERVTRVIRSGLRKSGPGPEFAIAVIGALPILAVATTAHGAVVKAGAAKGASNAGWLATLKAFGFMAAVLAVPTALGGLIGRQLRLDAEGSAVKQLATRKFWRFLILTILLLIYLPVCVTLFGVGFIPRESRITFLNVMTNWLGLSYAAVVIAVGYWLWKRRGTSAVELPTQTEAPVRPSKSRRTIILVTVAAAGLLTFCLLDTNYTIRFVDGNKIQDVVQHNDAANLRVSISQTYPRSIFRTYTGLPPIRNFRLEVKSHGKTIAQYMAPFDDATLAAITAHGLECPTYIQGRDFEILGAPGRMLPFITAFLLGIGAVYLLKTRRTKRNAG